VPDLDRAAIIRLTLSSLSAGADLDDIARSIAPPIDSHAIFPGDVLVELAADALELSGVSRATPLPYSGIRERFLPERPFSGNTDHQKSHTALRAVAMTHGGVEPDLAEDAGWWRVQDFWIYALYATVIYVRAAAERTGTTPAEICSELAKRHGVALDP
jgi:hypothetical protein